ncbi:agamous-like MADS-box protein AGL30 isoform X2 [Capsella rubella]|uniref:agamous-like MADS-box protein AGL30 isoform X2 n=1 Tax=Capsella rubella TaxID=81985 RepID=UPI000CD5602A|nr:agamous-like MADS-box protein AGL30 isoform X2 [Capsella rubella]
MGRVKLKIKKLQSMNARQSTYAKRKHGIMKKAKELSILCDIDVVLLMFSPTGKASLCIGKHSIGEVIAKFAQVIPQERTKRKLDSLEALRKMFVKIDHVVDISGFLDRSTPAVEVLSEKFRFLQTQLSDIRTRLSCWNDLENIDNLDDLQQLEHSLRLSLAQISARKASMPQLQRRQLMSSECKNELQTEIDIDFGMEMEQQLENFSWVRTDGNMNVPLKEEDPNLKLHQMYRDVTCSASSSLGNYTGIFSKSSDYISAPKLEPSSIPGISADPNVEFSNLSFLNDQKLQQLAEWNLLGSPADYYVSQILEASYKPQLGGNNNWASSDTLPYVAVFDDPLYFRQPKLEK